MSQLVHALPVPELRPLPEDLFAAQIQVPTIQFQYIPRNFQEAFSTNWASSNGLNREHPILQWSNGEQRGFTWEVQLWAKDSLSDISETIDSLKNACSRDPKLKRPLRFNLVWGDIVDEIVVIQSLGAISYNDIRPDGSARGVTMQLNMLVYRSVDVKTVEEEGAELRVNTFFAVVKVGDQWEDIALREYSDPMLGELLRRRNPNLPFPGTNPGAIVRLPKLINLRDELIEPDSYPLRRTADGLALRQRMFEARSMSRPSAIIIS